jgi:AcrR family transcriptional regulator
MTRAGRTLERMPARAVTPEGREQRERILRAAIELFTAQGFRGASLDRVAAAVGISRQGVLHYFPSKTHLLLGVLDLRDERTASHAGLDNTSLVEALLRIVADNQRDPDLTRLYTVLSAESVAPEHLGHEHFLQRYRMVREVMSQAVHDARESGELSTAIDDVTVATLLAAVMDGLQLQYLLEPEAVDMVEPFRAFLQLLGARPPH